MMEPTDEILGAYVDGELDPAVREELEAAMATQPQLAARAQRMRDTKVRLSAAFGGVLQEPVPDRLARVLESHRESAAISDFERARAAKAAGSRRGWSWLEWSAIAASVALGMVIGHAVWNSSPGSGLLRQQGSELIADGALADALRTQLASTQPAEAAVHVGLTFRARRNGAYCRTFTLSAGSGTAGIACQESDEWAVRALAGIERGAGGAQQAGTALPPALLTIIESEIEGEPLDAAGERAALEKHWRADR